MTIPIIPRLGLAISTLHVAASMERARNVWTSPKAKEITRELVNRIKNKK